MGESSDFRTNHRIIEELSVRLKYLANFHLQDSRLFYHAVRALTSDRPTNSFTMVVWENFFKVQSEVSALPAGCVYDHYL